MSIHIYIHFPYCLYKCHYCDFNSYPFEQEQIPFSSYTQSLIAELRMRQELYEQEGKHCFESGSSVATIYFGGGTPSLMRPVDVEKILKAIGSSFRVSKNTEITLETNPKTVTMGDLLALKKIGINRISLGVQSLHDSYLSQFGRIHSSNDARQALDMVARADFRSWNADFIFGFPGQKIEEWVADLEEIQQWRPPHLACYAFMVEEGSIYRTLVDQGKAQLPSEDDQSEMFVKTREILSRREYEAYEISNFSRSSHESRHNLNYWNYGPYLGLGAGAVSFLLNSSKSKNFGYRTTNFKLPNRYLKAITGGEANFFDEEKISVETAMGEAMMMGLRVKQGIQEDCFQGLFNRTVEDAFGPTINNYRTKGWIQKGGLALTEQGVLFSNQVMVDFLA